MQSLYDISAPAKLNRFLHIVGRRSDGYHVLQSVFMLIDWCDMLHFEVRPNGAISREDLTLPLPADDLCVRAAQALRAATGCTQGVHIRIEKSIPTQAGMGGGSSDAASTLLALNRLWNLRLPLSALLPIGLSLGADVPFFLGGHHAWVEGIGEHIVPIALPSSQWIVVKPAQGLDTRQIFSDPDLKRDTEAAIITGFAANGLSEYGRNDLQAVARKLCPGIDQALDWLASLGLQGRMTGSGSAVFAQLHAANPGDHGVDGLKGLGVVPAGLQVRMCSSLDVHPLVGWADSDGLAVDSISWQPV